MADHRDTNHDGKVSLMEKVKDKLHLGHKDVAHTTTHTTTGAVPVVGVVPVVAGHSSDLNHDGHISASERLAAGTHTGSTHSSGLHTGSTHSSGLHTGSAHSTGLHTGSHSEHHSSGHLTGHETDETRLRLHEEQLAISKREVGAGSVDIHKRVQEEHVSQTIPLRREEVTVERRPLHGVAEPGARIAAQDETVRVQLHREEVLTEKRIVPTEEVIVRKKEVIGHETVGATLRSEYVETSQTGSALHGASHMDTLRDGALSPGGKRKADSRDTNHDGHVSVGEKLKSARG
jgi:uncharacterized protein (TIGR02271 family)